MEIDGRSSWVLLLSELITGPELSSDDYASKEQALVTAIRSSGDTILQILQPLGHYLTTENDTPRSKAASLLAKVVRDVPEAVRTSEEVHHLAEFFTARLKDWPAIRGALLGCLALFERTPTPTSTATTAELSTADALSILSSFSKNVYVRSLSAFDRATALTALRLAVQNYGQAALDEGIDILEFAISSVDGEKDPRCLIQGFQAMQYILQLYISQDESTLASGRLEESTEELFDVLSCYFPVAFTPPPNDPHGITRDQIASELESALTIYPAFAPFIMELVSEKLSSTLLHAKMDALHLLTTAATAFGLEPAMRELIPAVWAALKKEIMAPTTEGLVEPELIKVEEVATAAAESLKTCIIAFSTANTNAALSEKQESDSSMTMSLPSLVLNDTGVEDMFTCIAFPGIDRASHRRSITRVKSMSLALSTLGAAGGQPAVEMVSKIFPALLDAVENSSDSSNTAGNLLSQDLAWASLASFLRAMATDIKAGKSNKIASLPIMDDALLARLLKAAMDANVSQKIENNDMMDESEAAFGGGEENVEIYLNSSSRRPASGANTAYNITGKKLWLWDLAETSIDRIQWLKLTVLQAILSCSHLAPLILGNQAQAILKFLVDVALDKKSGGGKLTGQPQMAAAATAALCAASRLLNSEIVIKNALTPLLQASTQVNILKDVSSSSASATTMRTRRAAALAALKSLCVSNPNALLQTTVVGLEEALHPAMQQMAQQQQQQPLLSGDDEDDASVLFVSDILTTLSEIMLEISTDNVGASSGTSSAAVHAACFATFAEHLLDEILLLAQEKESGKIALTGGDEDLIARSIAQAVFLGTKEASIEAQTKIANSSVEAVSLDTRSNILACAAGCAAFIALRKEVASETVSKNPTLLYLMVKQATEVSTKTDFHYYSKAAVVALASFLNKIEASQLDSLEITSVLSTLFDQTIYQGQVNSTSSMDQSMDVTVDEDVEYRFSVLAEVTRALAMRGAVKPADDLIRQVVSHLKSSSNLTTASSYFTGILYSEDDDDGTGEPALTRAAHAMVKPLWKQRTFNVAATSLDTASKDMLIQHEESNMRVLTYEMGSLLGAAPPAVLRADSARTVPWLATCLAELSKQEQQQQELSTINSPDNTKELLLSLLKSTMDFLSSESGRIQAEGSLATLVPALIRLGQYKPSKAVRELSLRCLTVLMVLPYAVMHPYKKEVLRVATAAADDAKRSVRAAAAMCREAWGGGSTSIV